jgi:hypothetical protein
MSDFTRLMEAISGDTVEEKIKTFSEVLDKITQFSVNSIDQVTKRLQKLNEILDILERRVVQIESRPPPAPAMSANPAAGGALGVPPPMPGALGVPPPPPMQAPMSPPPEPKPANPMSARSALQSELKNLFTKKKQ